MRRFDVARAGSRLLLALTLLAGCARGPDVDASGLALRRVVIYRNGVAYFERRGLIDAEQVTFRVRKEKVGDFLATLAVIEAGGSSVRSASFPVEVDDGAEGDEAPAEPEPGVKAVAPPPKGESAKKKDADKLEEVKLTLDGREHDLVVGYVAETPVWRPSYRLVMGAGEGARAPSKQAHLQAWGIVQNLSGEDWKGVRLSLVAGAPLAFQATLDKAAIPPRPIVSDQGEVIASVPTSETTLAAEAAPPPPAPAPAPTFAPAAPPPPSAEMADGYAYEFEEGGAGNAAVRSRADAAKPAARPAAKMSSGAPGRAAGQQAGPRRGGVALADEPQAMKGTAMNPSPPRNMSALAAVAMEAGTTRYDIPFPVDIPDKSATMVLLLAKQVPGESIFLFAPDGGVPASSSHPFRVARFTNDTKGLLERGPIAVFENGAFLGQGMVQPLPPGATTTVPFALERGLAVDMAREESAEGARLAKIEGGALEIERDWVMRTKYAVRNGSDLAARTLVKHPRLNGTRLHDPPKGTEDNLGTGSALVPVDVPRRGTAVLTVDERRVFRQQIDWLSQLADDAVSGYLKDPRADAAVVRQLAQAWDLRGKLRPALDERDKLLAEKQRLEQQSDELRQNLRAIEKNRTADALRRDLTDRLAKASARLDEITKRVIVLEMQISEQQIRFRDLTNEIKLLAPLSPVRAAP
ncbi:hypothetical protein SOCE26_047170 [Sorangium cellulosum]|uniref:DUF4139 domain-containing protein n=1 Tax=Sorangium cellulosum TaxID=56 RepID=A0A2L0EVF0_SORCE|nr:hypothetical protein [Sorangium cellulosum]AUX43273.1 hypothetical protein SOCE26_047170 [Sorangium cellulosum]